MNLTQRIIRLLIAASPGVLVGWFVGGYFGYGALWLAAAFGVDVEGSIYPVALLLGIIGAAAGASSGLWFARRITEGSGIRS